MAKELDSIIKIEDEDYNINAEHAKEADRVKNSLKIKRIPVTTSTDGDPVVVTEFDGDASKEISVVTADEGGRFKKRITVPSFPSTWASDGETVLNYNDIVNTVLKELKKTSILYTWNGTTLGGINAGEASGSTIQSISIITGADSAVNTLANEIFEKKPVAAYVYIADNGNIYFGTSTSNEVTSVQVSAENSIKANQLANSRNLIVSLAKTGTEAKNTKFDGTSDITLGISGILQPEHGGTGSTSLSATVVGYARQLQDASDGRKIATANDVLTNTDNIDKIISGTTAVAKATNADNATKLGTQAASYYQKKITVSASAPTSSDGSDGDIWIKY